MAFHAGYAASICLSEITAQEILHIYYSDGDTPVKVNEGFDVPLGGGKNAHIVTDLFMAEPQLLFEASSENKPGVNVRLYGTLTFTAPGIPTLTTKVSIKTKLFCPVDLIGVDNKGLQFTILINKGTVDSFSVSFPEGNNPKNSFGVDLNSSDTKAKLQFILLLQKDRSFIFTHPLLAQLKKTGASVTTADIKLFDGVFSAGINLEGFTAGNFDQLTNYLTVATERGYYKILSQFIRIGEDEGGRAIYDTGWKPTKKKPFGQHTANVAVSVNPSIVLSVFDKYGQFEIMKNFEKEKAGKIQAAIDKALKDHASPKYPDIKSIYINSIGVELKEGYILVHANVTREEDVDITTDVHAKMRIVSTDLDGDTAFVCDNQDLVGFKGEVFDVDIDQPGWLVALQVIGFIIGIVVAAFTPLIGLFLVFFMAVIAGAVIPGIIKSIENTTMLDLNKELGSAQGAVKLTLPGTEGPECSIRLEDFVVKGDSVTAWFDFDVNKTDVDAILVDSTTNYNWDVNDVRKIPVLLKLSKGFYHPEDPLVRIRWEVYAETTSNLIFNQDLVINSPLSLVSPLSIEIDHDLEAFEMYDSYIVKCRVYRPWGDWTEDIYNASITVNIFDMLERHEKYVKWGPHRVFWSVEGGWNGANRMSKIHKTDPDVRCKFVTHYSEKFKKNDLLYFSNLPFPIDQIKNKGYRRQVCDYCFFGGPDKKEPIR